MVERATAVGRGGEGTLEGKVINLGKEGTLDLRDAWMEPWKEHLREGGERRPQALDKR